MAALAEASAGLESLAALEEGPMGLKALAALEEERVDLEALILHAVLEIKIKKPQLNYNCFLESCKNLSFIFLLSFLASEFNLHLFLADMKN